MVWWPSSIWLLSSDSAWKRPAKLEVGFTIIAFDGAGSGRRAAPSIFFTPAWEQPAKAILDHFKLEQVDWLGASCGCYLAIRAAAFERRIKHVIALPATYWGLDMTLKQAAPGQDRRLISQFWPSQLALSGSRNSEKTASGKAPDAKKKTSSSFSESQGKARAERETSLEAEGEMLMAATQSKEELAQKNSEPSMLSVSLHS
jgi:pimeloyl-ACP methyl ester carboxylesterase